MIIINILHVHFNVELFQVFLFWSSSSVSKVFLVMIVCYVALREKDLHFGAFINNTTINN